MTKSEAGAIPHANTLRRMLYVLGGLLAAFIVGALLATWLVNRYVVFSIEEGKTQRSVLVQTPWGTFPTEQSNTIPSLWAVVYPKSDWVEQNNIEFYRGTEGDEAKSAQLIVLRFRVKRSLTQVNDWYRQRLGANFVHGKGWFIKANEGYAQDWLRQVRKDPNPEASVYSQKMTGRTRGVVLETQSDANGVLVTLYDFQEGEG